MKKITSTDCFLSFISFGILVGFIADLVPRGIGEKVIHYYAASIMGLLIYGLLAVAVLAVASLIFLHD